MPRARRSVPTMSIDNQNPADGGPQHSDHTQIEDHRTPTTDDDLNERDQIRKDRTYSPASETETSRKQEEHTSENLVDIDTDDVKVAPGTGGPDDVGDVEVDESEINMPRDTGAH